jgi:oxygen-dependent protoporphyrinogen oxidase
MSGPEHTGTTFGTAGEQGNVSAPPEPSSPRKVVVIGGGIAGLAAAHRLAVLAHKNGRPLSIVLLEAGDRLGGTIMTYNLQNMIIDLGPDMFLADKPAVMELINELGLSHRMVAPNKKHQRTFVARGDKLYPLPSGFFMMAPTQMLPFVTSDLFSTSGKLRILKDLVIPPAPEESDESLTQFVERRLGHEALERVIQPLVGGIYTGDPDKLSVKAALPRIWNLEKKYGSLIRGLASTAGKKQGESGARYGLFASFDGGMQALIDELESRLPANIMLNTVATNVTVNSAGNKFAVALGKSASLTADAVIVATPAYHAANLVKSLDAALAAELRGIEYSSAAVINWLFRRQDIPHALDGFGFVVPRVERRSIIACSFTSVKFPGRVPDNRALLRVFVGGALQPDVYDLTDEQMECLAWEDLHTYLNITAVPIVSIMSRFPKSMPQYNLGHAQRVTRIEQAAGKISGFALAGNAYQGVGIPDCIESANRAAAGVFTYLSQQA